ERDPSRRRLCSVGNTFNRRWRQSFSRERLDHWTLPTSGLGSQKRPDTAPKMECAGADNTPMRNWLRTNSSGTIHLSSISAPEEFPMTITLDQLAEALQSLFTTDADQAAKDSGMIRRKRKLTGAAFVQALVFHWLENPQATIEEIIEDLEIT